VIRVCIPWASNPAEIVIFLRKPPSPRQRGWVGFLGNIAPSISPFETCSLSSSFLSATPRSVWLPGASILHVDSGRSRM
jgi:hypothetical protein